MGEEHDAWTRECSGPSRVYDNDDYKDDEMMVITLDLKNFKDQ